MASVFHCNKNDFDYDCPTRERQNIIRSRNISNDTINNAKQERIKEFCRATGARRGGLIKLTVNDLREREDGNLEIHLIEKNKMERWALVDPQKKDFVKEVFRDSKGYQTNGEIRLFDKREISNVRELHSCRCDYAISLYKHFEKEGYANNLLYHCRKDKIGITYNKGILKEVSENLGHHRLDVVVSHYLYK